MKQVRIAELKARLSEHLRRVQRGESLTVLDRDTPIAQIVPVRTQTRLRIRKPKVKAPLGEMRLPEPLDIGVDIVTILLEERQNNR